MAADAVERIVLDLEPLPFVLDPLDSLRPGGPNARLDGNTMTGTTLATIKWDGADWAAILQAVSMMAPMMHKAAKQLNVDPLEMIRINAPEGQAFGPPRQGARPNVSSAFVREAAEAGAAAFDWPGMRAKSGRRDGTRVTGIGVALSAFTAGASGMDGPLTIRPDGKVYIQQGIGSLGTKSVFDTARAAMEVLDTDWDQAEVIWGNTSKHLPWSAIQAGTMTTHALTRSNHAAGKDAKRKLQEIAARDLGDSPDDYDVSDGRVFRRGNRSQGLGFAQAARRAVELGGRSTGAATAAWRPTRSLFEPRPASTPLIGGDARERGEHPFAEPTVAADDGVLVTVRREGVRRASGRGATAASLARRRVPTRSVRSSSAASGRDAVTVPCSKGHSSAVAQQHLVGQAV